LARWRGSLRLSASLLLLFAGVFLAVHGWSVIWEL
jgi:hypothetical protein